jgi:ABC-type methionine transport system ATPase subunit
MKRRYALRFSPALVEEPIVSRLVRTYDVDINILNADVASGRGGKLIVELSGSAEALSASVSYLNALGIRVSEMVTELLFDEEECIHCGAVLQSAPQEP